MSAGTQSWQPSKPRNEPPTIEKITVITEYPEKLNEKNWDSGSPSRRTHSNPFDDPRNASRLEMVEIDAWKRTIDRDLSEHFRGEILRPS